MSNPPPPSDPGQDPTRSPGGQPGEPTGGPYGDPGQQGQPGPGQYGDPGQQQGQYGAAYGQTPPPPPGQYGAPGGYQQPQKNSPLAITSLVTGIVGVVLCLCWSIPIFAVAAVVTGVLGGKQVKDNPAAYKGAGMAKAGLILGIVGIVIAVAYWVAFALGAFDSFMQYEFDAS